MSSNGSYPKHWYGIPIIDWYTYTDSTCKELYRVARAEKTVNGEKEKKFPVWCKDSWGLEGKGIKKTLYALHILAGAKTVFVVEGEKDVHTLCDFGVAATTNPGGASKWDDAYSVLLKNKDVVILPDNDEPGKRHAVQVAKSVKGIARSVKIVELPGLPNKGDITDWLTGRDREAAKKELRQLWKTAPEFDPVSYELNELNELSPSPHSLISSNSFNSLSQVPSWPELGATAFHGVAGEIIRALQPHTESDPAAMLIQFLICYGNVIGRNAHACVESDRHYCNENAVIVGLTSKGRKGTSLGRVRNIISTADPEWEAGHLISGLSTGEGLIWSVRDQITKQTPVREDGNRGKISGYENVIDDPGVADKRFVFQEAEFASTLKIASREGNILSGVIRNAWDTGSLRIQNKNSPVQATGAHISIIGHATKDELLRYLNNSEAGNGFANRFLWVCSQRAQCLPDGGVSFNLDFDTLERIKRAILFGKSAGEIRRVGEARELWSQIYPELSEGKPGLMGAMIARSEAHVLRLSMIYALLDCSHEILTEHLTAALTVWKYCEDSARFIFGSALGDPVADEILQALRSRDRGMTRTEINVHFNRNKSRDQLDRALFVIVQNQLAIRREEQTGGRTAERFIAIRTPVTKETNYTNKVPSNLLVSTEAAEIEREEVSL